MSGDEFEDEYFNDVVVGTGARMMRKPSQGSKTIQANRKQQLMARRIGKKYKDNERLIFRKDGTGLVDVTKPKPKIDTGLPDVQDDNSSSSQDPPPGVGKGSKPGFFNDNNHLDVNVTIRKEHETAPVEEPKISNEELKYRVSKHVEHNRDLYFVRLVAGSLKRSFESMIVVEQKSNSPFPNLNGKITVDIKYFYNNELLHAWASIVEKVKLMIYTNTIGWASTVEVHDNLINRDTTCVAFARYVAFVIMTESNNLIPRNRTRYVIDSDGQIEDKLVIDLMRAIHTEYGVLKQELVARFL